MIFKSWKHDSHDQFMLLIYIEGSTYLTSLRGNQQNHKIVSNTNWEFTGIKEHWSKIARLGRKQTVLCSEVFYWIEICISIKQKSAERYYDRVAALIHRTGHRVQASLSGYQASLGAPVTPCARTTLAGRTVLSAVFLSIGWRWLLEADYMGWSITTFLSQLLEKRKFKEITSSE